MVRRGHARTVSGQALLAFGKPHSPSNLHARTVSGQALLAFGKPHSPSNLHARTVSGQALLAFGKPHSPSNLRCPDLPLSNRRSARRGRRDNAESIATGLVVCHSDGSPASPGPSGSFVPQHGE